MVTKTEKQILNRIPDAWDRDISAAEIRAQAEKIFHETIAKLSKKTELNSIHSPEKIIAAFLRGTGEEVGRAIAELQVLSFEKAKAVLFTERYGHILPRDVNGQLSLSSAMWVKITGHIAHGKHSPWLSEFYREPVKGIPRRPFMNVVQEAYFKWVKTPYPLFPWRRKKREKAYRRATSDFVRTMVQYIYSIWSANPMDTELLDNLCTFSIIAEKLFIHTFILAYPIMTATDHKQVVDPFRAPEVLLLAENSTTLLFLIEMLEDTFEYQVDDRIRPMRKALERHL